MAAIAGAEREGRSLPAHPPDAHARLARGQRRGPGSLSATGAVLTPTSTRQRDASRTPSSARSKNTRERTSASSTPRPLARSSSKAPTRARFLDMLYTNMMSDPEAGPLPLRPDVLRERVLDGRRRRRAHRRGHMALPHHHRRARTVSIGHMEEWLQTEWWDWKVWVVNATEQYRRRSPSSARRPRAAYWKRSAAIWTSQKPKRSPSWRGPKARWRRTSMPASSASPSRAS